jgi:hypothetical protein
MAHELYGPGDFTAEELLYSRNLLAVLVVDGGLSVCKRCGAAEAELDDHPTCEAYRAHLRMLLQQERAFRA